VVATDKKITAGGNKAHQGLWSLTRVLVWRIDLLVLGTDHQRIAKLDRENEVAPPPKIAPSVGRVGIVLLIVMRYIEHFKYIGYASCSSRIEVIPEGCRSEG